MEGDGVLFFVVYWYHLCLLGVDIEVHLLQQGRTATPERRLMSSAKSRSSSCLYLECVHQLPIVYNLAAGVVVQLLCDGNELRGEAIVLHKLPDDVSIHTVECLLEVGEY